MSVPVREIPPFLAGNVEPKVYRRWLVRKAAAHAKRDRLRGHTGVSEADYRDAIHQAVMESNARDAYTGEQLDWALISTYDNKLAKAGGHAYKAQFALLPSVDHVDASSRRAAFRICGWRTNDAKHDLSIEEFRQLCARVLRHAGFEVRAGSGAVLSRAVSGHATGPSGRGSS